MVIELGWWGYRHHHIFLVGHYLLLCSLYVMCRVYTLLFFFVRKILIVYYLNIIVSIHQQQSIQAVSTCLIGLM